MIKVRITKNDGMPEHYAQGEYRVDLTKQFAEVAAPFAAHLVNLGYAEYLASDLKAAEAKTAAALAGAPDFVARETSDEIPFAAPSVGEVAPVPTEELTLAPNSSPATISDPPTAAEPVKEIKRGKK